MMARKEHNMAADEYMVRIRPDSPRQEQIVDNRTFRKDMGWIWPVTAEMAKRLAEIPLNELVAERSPKVFQVMCRAEAMQLQASERVVIDPKGTVEHPRPVPLQAAPVRREPLPPSVAESAKKRALEELATMSEASPTGGGEVPERVIIDEPPKEPPQVEPATPTDAPEATHDIRPRVGRPPRR